MVVVQERVLRSCAGGIEGLSGHWACQTMYASAAWFGSNGWILPPALLFRERLAGPNSPVNSLKAARLPIEPEH